MQPESNAFSAACSALADACRRRRAARAAWADKLHALIERADNSHATERLALPNCGGHRIEYADIEADCSQWGNRIDYPSTSGSAWVVDGRWWLTKPDLGFFDGHNRQRQVSCPRLPGGPDLAPAPVSVLADIARALPEQLAAWVAEQTASVLAECEVAEQQ